MRLIAKLDVKPPYVVKPVHFEGLRKMGDPIALAKEYAAQGADEIVYIDIVSSLYQRPLLVDSVKATAEQLFVPFCVGGGVKSLADFKVLFHSGADKVVCNTQACANPSLVEAAAKTFGSQSVAVHIDAKRIDGKWYAYTDCGRINSGLDVVDWVKELENRGAGEIILQSVDCDGRQRGFDIELAAQVVSSVGLPVIVASGAGDLAHIEELASQVQPSGIAVSSVLHYKNLSIGQIKAVLPNQGQGALG